MTIVLGSKPEKLDVVLVVDGDFVQNVRRKDGTDWPAGSVLQIAFKFSEGADVVWEATYNGAIAAFHEDDTTVNEVIAASPRGSRFWFIDEFGARNQLGSGNVKVSL